MSVQEKFLQAKDQGYSDEEIFSYLGNTPEFGEKIKNARETGFSDKEIFNHISGNIDKQKSTNKDQPQKTGLLSKIARNVSQLAIGLAESRALPYEIAVAPLSNEQAQLSAFRSTLSDDLERLMDQKAAGIWDDKDQALYDNIVDQIKNPRKSEQFVKTADIGIQGLFEKATGIDMKPEGSLEKAFRWAGWIKNPKNISNISKSGLSKKEFIKSITPTGKESFRGLAAGTALQAAEDGDLGPIGSLAAAIAADATVVGSSNILKQGSKFLKSPKKNSANLVASVFGKKQKLDLQKQIINDFRKSGIQADLGTITDSNLVRMIQTKLGQSGLTGKPMEELRKNITQEVIKEYNSLAENVGKSRFENTFEAGQTAQETVKNIRTKDLNEIREIYKSSSESLTPNARSFTDRLSKKTEDLISKLEPGSIKSAEQKTVLDSLNRLKSDLFKNHPDGRTAFVKDLINNKQAINDIINYEVQGGAKQLLKGVVAELDRAIISHGPSNNKFANEYVKAQKRFSQHAKTFRNKNIDQIIRAQDPSKSLSKMNSIQGIRDLKKALSFTKEGRDLFNDLRRFKLDEMISKKMIDSTTRQIKFGTFSKMFETGNNREIAKEILGNSDFRRLEILQKNSGKLAESINKFLNTSQTATSAFDAASLLKLINDASHLLSGNPWPLIKSGTFLGSSKYMSKLFSDPEFLKLVEESIIASKSGNVKKSNLLIKKLIPYAKISSNQISQSNRTLNQEPQ